MKATINYDRQSFSIELTPTGKTHRATLGNKTVDIEILGAQDGQLNLLIDGEHITAYVSSDGTKRWVTVNGRTYLLTKQTGSRKSGSGYHHTAGGLTAPMPGQVRMVNVSEGEVVVKGQTLMVLEAMKMEIRIQASMDGLVKKIFVSQGQTVEREQILIEIE
jgi:acetyl/propionyl-CoA carboxylase alpha subunit